MSKDYLSLSGDNILKVHSTLTKLEIQNGFDNFGLGPRFSCKLISGTISAGDFLILPNGLKVPIASIIRTNLDIKYGLYSIVVPLEYENSYKWYELYGQTLEVQKGI
jgi:hypothetical protein